MATTDTPFDQREGFIWYNGAMVPWADARVHVLTHGLHYGSGVFEGIRAYHGRPFKMTEHNQRLIHSAEILDMKVPYSVDELDAACLEAMKANNLTDCYIRPLAFRGPEQMGIGAIGTRIHVIIAVWAWPSYFPPGVLEKGISLIQVKWRKPAPETAPVESKAAGGYMIGTLSKHEAIRAGYTDALMLDYRGYVAESSAANIFVVTDGKIKTPIADCFLNGITRQTVIQLCKDFGIPVEETRITVDELLTADEVFVTGTAVEITPVGKINDTTFTPGAITKRLMDAYKNLVSS